MNVMEYKGYKAAVEFDARDDIFTGRVLGIGPIIGFHGETVDGLRKDFEAAINFLLEDCAKRGVSPEKPVSGKMLLRLPPETHRAALIAAKASGMSLNQWAAKVLEEAAQHAT